MNNNKNQLYTLTVRHAFSTANLQLNIRKENDRKSNHDHLDKQQLWLQTNKIKKVMKIIDTHG